MAYSRLQLAAAGLSVATTARLSGVGYNRLQYWCNGGLNLTPEEEAKIKAVVLTAIANNRRLEAIATGGA